jgi:AraC-like DNA-binding protein
MSAANASNPSIPTKGFAVAKEPTYHVYNTHNMFESYHSVVEEGADNRVPVFAHIGGNSVWKKDVKIEKRNNPYFFVELVTAGNLLLIQNGKKFLVEPGMIFFNRLGASLTYSVGPAGFVHKRFAGMKGVMLESMLTVLGLDSCDTCGCADPVRFAALLRETLRMLRSREQGHMRKLASAAYEMLLIIADNVAGPNYPEAVRAAKEFMQQNISRPASVEQVASAAGVSVPHLYRLFREAFGCAPMRAFTEMKMAYAAALLRQANLTVKEVGVRVGFEEPSYFSKVFKQIEGVTPGEMRSAYRQNVRKEQETK